MLVDDRDLCKITKTLDDKLTEWMWSTTKVFLTLISLRLPKMTHMI